MAVNYPIPPWISQPADPAAHYATGLQIGVRIGQENAAQAYQQQQLLRQQAEDAFEQEYKTAKLNLDVDKIRRQQQAISGYQADVQSGMAPEQALMKWGPELGESVNETLRTQAMGKQQEAMLALRKAQSERRSPALLEAEDVANAQAKLAALPEGPDKERQKSIVESMLSRHKGLSAHLSYDDQGRPILDLGQGQATVGTQTAVQTELANLRNSVVQIDRAKRDLTDKDLGVAGAVWDRALNRWVSQVIPEAGDPEVSANRAQLQKAVDSYLESQQAKGRLSAPERKAVRDTLVTQNLGESLPRAQAVLNAMSRIQKFESISRAKAGQQPLQPWMFEDLSQSDIKELLSEGALTLEEAKQWALRAKSR